MAVEDVEGINNHSLKGFGLVGRMWQWFVGEHFPDLSPPPGPASQGMPRLFLVTAETDRSLV